MRQRNKNDFTSCTEIIHDCAKSLQGEAPCGNAVYGKVDEMSPAPSPSPHAWTPLPPAWTPLGPA